MNTTPILCSPAGFKFPAIYAGDTFGRLTVVGPAPSRKSGRWVKASCVCGRAKEIRAAVLHSGETKSCGCLNSEQSIDLVGFRSSRLCVTAKHSWDPERRKTMWECRCDCGKQTIVSGSRLTTGQAKSCGCLRSDKARDRVTKHGKARTSEYSTYCHIKKRCFNPGIPQWKDYGGRGITMCDRWQHGDGGISGFLCFYSDMGAKPIPGLTIDRIDNNGHYSCGKCAECRERGWPMNCRWTTPLVQGNNKRSNVIVTAFGKSQTLAQWSRETHIGPSTLKQRLSRGMSPEIALAMTS